MNQPKVLSENQPRFEVAISFAGDNKRDLVREIAELLRNELGEGKVFFDEFFEHEIAGQDADLYLQDIYLNQTSIVVTCICKRYDEKAWTQDEWRAIRAFERNKCRAPVSRLRFLPLRFGDGEVEGIYSNAIVPDVRDRTAAQIAKCILDRHAAYKSSIAVPANPEQGTKEIEQKSIFEFTGVLRQHPIESVKPLVSIANAILRGDIRPDLVPPSGNPITTIVVDLVSDPISTDGTTHPLVRFAVLLHELSSIYPQLQTDIRNWFDTACGPLGFEFAAVLGELPDIPVPASRFIWLDVSWDNSVPGETVRPARSHLRCGNLQYPFENEVSIADTSAQFSKIVSSYSLTHQSTTPVNHAAAVSEVADFQTGWEYDSNGKLLNIPVTVRSSTATDGRQTLIEIEETCLCEYGDPEDFAIHVQERGFFATGKVDGTGSFPCTAMTAYLTHATIGLWTRGPQEDDKNETRLQDAVRNKPAAIDLPKIIHGRRAGAIPTDSVWRRVVLYFNPNIPPLQIEPEDDLPFNNSQLV